MRYYQRALEIDPRQADVLNNLGTIAFQRQDIPQAIGYFQKALESNPRHPDAQDNLGIALYQQGNREEAIAHFRKALESNPDLVSAHNNLGTVLHQEGKTAEAVAQWREVIRLAPNAWGPLTQTAWILATHPDATFRNGAEALELAQRAVRLSNAQEPSALDTLAAAYAEAGRFPEAIETAEQAISLATAKGKAPMAEAMRTRLKLYQGNTAARDSGPEAGGQGPAK
jgi:spermidine synthase